MKKLFFPLAAVLSMLISSCSGDEQADLLSAVPYNTHSLTIINQNGIISKSGEDADASKDALAVLLSHETTQKGEKAGNEWNFILGDKDGIDPESPIVIYEYKQASLATFNVTDAEAFREGVGAVTGESFSESRDIWASSKNRIFTKGNQAWITSGYPELTSSDIAVLTSLKENESILSVGKARELSESRADVAFLYYIRDLMQFGIIDSNVSLALNLAYEDPEYLTGYINYESGKAIAEIRVLDGKVLPAKRALSPGKIDMEVAGSLQSEGNIFAATSLDSATISTILDQFKNKAILPVEFTDILRNVDGSVVASCDTDSKSGSAVFSMKDNDSALSTMELLESYSEGVSEDLELSVDGRLLYIRWGVPAGVPVSEVITDFENANLAIVVFTDRLPKECDDFKSDIESVSIVLADEEESSVIKATASTSKGIKSLFSLLESVL